MQVSDVPGRRIHLRRSLGVAQRVGTTLPVETVRGSCGGTMPALTSYLPPQPVHDSPLAGESTTAGP